MKSQKIILPLLAVGTSVLLIDFGTSPSQAAPPAAAGKPATGLANGPAPRTTGTGSPNDQPMLPGINVPQGSVPNNPNLAPNDPNFTANPNLTPSGSPNPFPPGSPNLTPPVSPNPFPAGQNFNPNFNFASPTPNLTAPNNPNAFPSNSPNPFPPGLSPNPFPRNTSPNPFPRNSNPNPFPQNNGGIGNGVGVSGGTGNSGVVNPSARGTNSVQVITIPKPTPRTIGSNSVVR